MRYIQILFLGLILVGLVGSQETKKCHCLSMSGGGSMGSYEAGVFIGLVKNQTPKDRTYDVVSGVSAGSINAFIIALFASGDEEAAADYLYESWAKLTPDIIFDSWKYGIIQGLIKESGLFNTDGIVDYLMSEVNILGIKELKRAAVFGITDADTGEYKVVDNKHPMEEMAKYVVASLSIPVLFKDMKMDNTTYIDGGVLVNLNSASAVLKCRQMGYADKDIVVDIVLTKQNKVKYEHMEESTTLTMLFRYLTLNKHMKAMFMVDEQIRAFPDVNWRYLISPTTSLPGDTVPLDFKPEDSIINMNQGALDAKNAIQKGRKAKDIVTELKNDLFTQQLEAAGRFL